MSNVIVEGFGAYGVGQIGNGTTPVALAMLSGAYASVAGYIAADKGITTLPWDAANPDTYFYYQFGDVNNIGIDYIRRVLPEAQNEVDFSFYYGCNSLPLTNNVNTAILAICDSGNSVIAKLQVTTTGSLRLVDSDGTTIAATSGPVLVAEKASHIECQFNVSNGTFVLYADGTKVIDASGITFSDTSVAQYRLGTVGSSPTETAVGYIGHLIVRDSGSTFPVGDRKVATLLPNKDDAAHQGWTAQPLHRFGVGILDLAVDALGATPALKAVTGPGDTHTDLGAGDFTLEGQFRFQALPTGSNKAVFFGKWDEAANTRSYQLYLGGPELENGLLVFRTSTDGQNGTVVEKLKWAWSPVIGHWYHVALVRSSGELLLFIDGIQQGLPEADTDTYFAGTALPTLGAQTHGSTVLAGTNLQGWQDEFRLSVGLARYTANFTPPTDGFPRNSDDPNWGSVAWLSSWDDAVVADDGPNGLALVARNGAAAITPDDGEFAYQTIDGPQPTDNTFIEAALLPATGLFTLSALPAANDTVTVGTKDGSAAAVYKFVAAVSAAYDVAIGATIQATMSNLVAAVIAGTGAGTAYGTGTVANADATAQLEPTNQMLVTALTPGTGGNAIASTTTAANGSWGGATLSGGENIPPYSQFSFQRLPSNTSVVDSITIAARQWKTDAGSATTQVSFVGADGGKTDGAANVLSTTPTLTFDTFDTDPDSGDALTPTSILLSKVRVNRTV
ncbi:MAG TPA: LamG-like jellyroll fold domain-containing protein [Rhizobiaceae bacterium]|nr:LamG-like jellyroll fold domain-containing protein [Rhizobiaceae bacterium]